MLISLPVLRFSITGPVGTTRGSTGTRFPNLVRSRSMTSMVLRPRGRLRVRAVRSMVSIMLASTRPSPWWPATFSNSSAGGAGSRSQMISLSAPTSRSQCAPEMRSNWPISSTCPSHVRRSSNCVSSESCLCCGLAIFHLSMDTLPASALSATATVWGAGGFETRPYTAVPWGVIPAPSTPRSRARTTPRARGCARRCPGPRSIR